MKRSGSSIPPFVQRIPADLRGRVARLKLNIPLSDGEFHHTTISAKAKDLRFLLRARDSATAKMRQATVLAYLGSVWKGLRATEPASLTRRQAIALAGRLYRARVSGEGKERTWAVTHTRKASCPYPTRLDEEEAVFFDLAERLQAARDYDPPTLSQF